MSASGDLFAGLDQGPRCGEVEAWAARQGYGALLGLDEAGRGPLAGPVVCAAAVLPYPSPRSEIEGLNDSKQVSARERERLFDVVQERALAFAVAVVDIDDIARLNILHASLEGMRRAWAQVVADHPELADALVLVDGHLRAPLPDSAEQRPIVKGDARSLNIAAASILAKVTRDRLMVAYDARWPQYGFAQHKGYPTKAHRAAVLEHGPCEIHRRSFKLPGVEPSA